MKTILNAVQTWTKGKIKDSTADWNQDNPNADNYVKNRTHWEEEDGTIHKLDSKYLDLPDNIATTTDVQEIVNDVSADINNSLNNKIDMPITGEFNQVLSVSESTDGIPNKIGCMTIKTDWEQYDASQIDYINNRTHYHKVLTYASVENAQNQEGSALSIALKPVGYLQDRKRYLHDDSFFRIIINGVENLISTDPWRENIGHTVLYELNAGERSISTGISLKIDSATKLYRASISLDSREHNIVCSAYYEQRYVKLLDEKYLPTTIARISDIPSIEGLATEEYVDNAIAANRFVLIDKVTGIEYELSVVSGKLTMDVVSEV